MSAAGDMPHLRIPVTACANCHSSFPRDFPRRDPLDPGSFHRDILCFTRRVIGLDICFSLFDPARFALTGIASRAFFLVEESDSLQDLIHGDFEARTAVFIRRGFSALATVLLAIITPGAIRGLDTSARSIPLCPFTGTSVVV
jgi:hypothetical protein